eukprot:COSAG01_NODE_5215_length_4406_cov_2.137683_3_plen_117_part_00
MRRQTLLRVRVERTGSQKCGIVGESQPALMTIDPILFTRTRIPTIDQRVQVVCVWVCAALTARGAPHDGTQVGCGTAEQDLLWREEFGVSSIVAVDPVAAQVAVGRQRVVRIAPPY